VCSFVTAPTGNHPAANRVSTETKLKVSEGYLLLPLASPRLSKDCMAFFPYKTTSSGSLKSLPIEKDFPFLFVLLSGFDRLLK
jgi:hypothetical protein